MIEVIEPMSERLRGALLTSGEWSDVHQAAFDVAKREAVFDFFKRVCERAEINMLKTGKLEGAHFAAMKSEIATLKQATEQITAPDRLRATRSSGR